MRKYVSVINVSFINTSVNCFPSNMIAYKLMDYI